MTCRERADVEHAVAGVETVVSAVQGFAGPGRVTPESVDHAGNVTLIDSAANGGADFVLLSVVGAAPDHPMELFRAKHAAEEHLRRSNLPWTIVRATAYVETWATIIGEPLRNKGKTMVFGRGDNPINFVSVTDVAALVGRAIEDPALRTRTLEIGGPDNVTFNELVATMKRVAGVDGAVRHIPRSMLRVMAAVAGAMNATLARRARRRGLRWTRSTCASMRPRSGGSSPSCRVPTSGRRSKSALASSTSG